MEPIRRALRKNDAKRLRELSKELIYRAVEEYDKHLAELAIVAYTLSKLLSKTHIVSDPRWKQYKKVLLDAVEKEYPPEKIVGILSRIDEEMGNFVRSTIEKARVKLASDAYATGMSVRAASELTGADPSDVADYIGKTKIHDEEEITISLKDRVGALRRLLG